jgi:hypothetical protein
MTKKILRMMELLFPFEKGDTAKPRGFLEMKKKRFSVLRTAPLQRSKVKKKHQWILMSLMLLRMTSEMHKLLYEKS